MFGPEVASFRWNDEPCLVEAALACRVCLSGVDWRLELDDWDPQVECACLQCGDRRVVGLDGQQALRLYLARWVSVAA
jgi:hypothetical protein